MTTSGHTCTCTRPYGFIMLEKGGSHQLELAIADLTVSKIAALIKCGMMMLSTPKWPLAIRTVMIIKLYVPVKAIKDINSSLLN